MRLWKKSADTADPKPCLSCKGTDVELDIYDGSATCKNCGYRIKVKGLGVSPVVELKRAWQNERTNLCSELRGIKKRLGELRKLGIY